MTNTLNKKTLSEESNKTTPPTSSFWSEKTGQETKICMQKALLSCFIPADYRYKKTQTNSSLFFFFVIMKGVGDAVRQHWGQDGDLESSIWVMKPAGVLWGVGGKGPLNWKTDTGLEKTHIAVHWKVSLHLSADFIWTVFWILNEAIWKWPAKYKIIILN